MGDYRASRSVPSPRRCSQGSRSLIEASADPAPTTRLHFLVRGGQFSGGCSDT